LEFSEIPYLIEAYLQWLYSSTYQETLEQIYMSDPTQKTEAQKKVENYEASPLVKRLIVVMSSPGYELCTNIITLMQLMPLVIIFSNLLDERKHYDEWCVVCMCINFVHLIELIVDFVVFGSKVYKVQFRAWPETVCQILNVAGIYFFFKHEADTAS
jgi:hypothetical protein